VLLFLPWFARFLALPNYIVEGSITEFDKDFATSCRTEEIDFLVGGGSSETDTGIARDKSKRVSRIVIDLHLLDYSSHAVVPGVVVSNAILVVELEKQKDFGFAIYGSGVGTQGKIKQSQGFHRAVRNLVEYSVLQLLGKFYNMPYWEILGLDGIDPGVTRSLRRAYTRQRPAGKFKIVQQKLNLVQPATASQTANGQPYTQVKVDVDGHYGAETYRSIETFVNAFRPDINISDLPKRARDYNDFSSDARRVMEEVYVALRTQVASANLAMLPEMQSIRQDFGFNNGREIETAAVGNINEGSANSEDGDSSAEESTADTQRPANRTSPKVFFDSFNRAENVFENRVYNQ